MIRKIKKLSELMLRKALLDSRFLIVAFLLAMLLYDGINRVNMLAGSEKIGIEPYLFPHMTSMSLLQIILFACFLIIISDIPYINKNSYTFLIRSGKKPWILSVILSVQVLAFVYVAFLFLMSIIYILPSISFSKKWGELFEGLKNGGNTNYLMFPIVNSIIASFTPIKACIHAFLLEYFALLFLGFFMMAVNFITKSRIGIYLSFAIAAFDLVIPFAFGDAYYKYSPMSLSRLSNIAVNDVGLKASLGMAYAVLILGAIVFAGISYYLFQKNSLETMAEGANA